MINLIRELIRIESVSGNEAKLSSFFASWIAERFPVKPTVDDRNIVIDITGPDFSPETGTTLLLCSHIDTVPACDGWTKDPWGAVQEGEKIYGLGANDALASVVSMTFGAIDAAPSIKTGRLLLAFVCEEEKGGNGFATIEPKLPRYTYGIFGEPTSLRIGHCMRGSMKLKMITRGKSCHASRPHEGENAVFNLLKDLQKLKDLPLTDTSPWGQATVEPTKISGGTSDNQIPDRIETFLDSRPTWEVNNDTILSLLQKSGIEFEVLRNTRRAMSCDTDSPLIKAVERACPKSTLYAFGGSCDMAFSTAPSVVFGPGGSERSHSADEFITTSELEAARAAYAAIIKELL